MKVGRRQEYAEKTPTSLRKCYKPEPENPCSNLDSNKHWRQTLPRKADTLTITPRVVPEKGPREDVCVELILS